MWIVWWARAATEKMNSGLWGRMSVSWSVSYEKTQKPSLALNVNLRDILFCFGSEENKCD